MFFIHKKGKNKGFGDEREEGKGRLKKVEAAMRRNLSLIVCLNDHNMDKCDFLVGARVL